MFVYVTWSGIMPPHPLANWRSDTPSDTAPKRAGKHPRIFWKFVSARRRTRVNVPISAKTCSEEEEEERDKAGGDGF